MSLRVVVDARPLDAPFLRRRGIGRFAASLVPELAGVAAERGGELELLRERGSDGSEFAAGDADLAGMPVVRLPRAPVPERVADLPDQLLLPVALRRRRPDVFGALSMYRLPLAPGVTTVVTMHDVIPLMRPGQLKTGIVHGLLYAAVRRADRVIAVSEAGRRDLVAHLDISAERVDVVYEAAGPQFVPTEQKVELIDALSATGVAKIEVTSFVSPKAVPNLRDAETVMAGIRRNPEVKYVALIANLKGAERAIAARADEVNLVVSVSETHNRANVRRSTDASFEGFREIMRELDGTGIAVAGALSTAFGCPFEGEQAPGRVMEFVGRYVELGVRSVTLADTTGMGHPKQVLDLCTGVRERWPELELALHFHNTRGMGLANVLSGLATGVQHYEACLGGLGGCPFAPGATGNICTEDLVHMLECMGYTTGVNLDKLLAVSKRLGAIVSHDLPGQVVKAGKATDLHPIPGGLH